MSRRVLITGANGFIGQHIVAAFLEAGHSVHGIVRSQSKATQLATIFQKYVPIQLDFGIVPDIAAPGAFDAALQSDPPFDVVVHSASPFNYRKNTSNADFLDPAVRGTTGILRSIATGAPAVRRVVLTGSMASIIDFSAPARTSPPKVYTEEDWNPTSWETALVTNNMGTVYQASKKFAEKAAWDFVAGKAEGQPKPTFDLAVLNPPMVYGPMVDPSVYASPADLPESLYGIYHAVLSPELTESSPVPAPRLHLYVDARDVAKAHLLAATTPAAGGHRFVLSAGSGHMTPQRMANILRERLPKLRGRVPRGDPTSWRLGEGTFDASHALAEEVLGLRFRPAEETIGDLGPQLVEVERRAAGTKGE